MFDTGRIRSHAKRTNAVAMVHELSPDDVPDANKRDLLRHAFADPERLWPAETRQALTEEAAERFAALFVPGLPDPSENPGTMLARRLPDRHADADAASLPRRTPFPAGLRRAPWPPAAERRRSGTSPQITRNSPTVMARPGARTAKRTRASPSEPSGSNQRTPVSVS